MPKIARWGGDRYLTAWLLTMSRLSPSDQGDSLLAGLSQLVSLVPAGLPSRWTVLSGLCRGAGQAGLTDRPVWPTAIQALGLAPPPGRAR